MESRRNEDERDLLYSEKFDVWLNLNPLILFNCYLYRIKTWDDFDMSLFPNLIDRKTLLGLREVLKKPYYVEQYKVSPLLPATIISDILNLGIPPQNEASLKVRNLHEAIHPSVIRSLKMQIAHLISNVDQEGQKDLILGHNIWNIKMNSMPWEYYPTYAVYLDFIKCVNAHKKICSNNKINHLTHVFTSIPDTMMVLTQGIMFFKYMGTMWLLNRVYLLELLNKLGEFKSLLLFNHLQSGTNMPDKHYYDLIRFSKHCVREILRYGVGSGSSDLHTENQGFLYIKTMEGLAVSEIIRRTDKKWTGINDTLWRALWGNLYDDRLSHTRDYKGSEVYSLFNSMPLPSLSDLVGIVKVFGHPSIEIEAGLDDLHKKTHETLIVDDVIRDRARGMMIREITKSYYIKHEKYPNFTTIPDSAKSLNILIKSKLSPVSRKGRVLWNGIHLDAWACVIFGKNAVFDRVENQLALLKDKALGLTRSYLLEKYILDAGILQNNGALVGTKRKETKALLAYLFDDQFDSEFQNYLDNYMSRDEWDDRVLEYLVIKLTSKELELKCKGRLFGSSPIVERNRRVVQEYNVMRFMSQYVSDQLLTPNELEVMKKLINFRSLRSTYTKCTVLNISFDFSSWNNRMRSDAVDKVANILDNWFEVNLYGKTMKAFQNMMVYYDDGYHKRYWDGQEGGIEGLNQATWSLAFIGGMRCALEQTGYKYQVTVKGDDVRAAVIIPNEHLTLEDINAKSEKVMELIRKLCEGMKWKLNPNESFISTSLIATSKQYLVDDVMLPTASKKIMRSEAHGNIPFPTMEDTAATMFSVAHAVCSQTTSCLPPFITALYQCAALFYGHSQRRKPSLSADELTIMISWPQVIGGPGSLPIQTFFVRGENDMLAVSISLMRFILNKGSEAEKLIVSRILSQPLEDPTETKSMLLGDPYSICIKTPIRPQSLIKAMLRKSLRLITKNPSVKELFSNEFWGAESNFKAALLSMDPYFPRIASSIWECSPFFLIEELLSKFINSTTVIAVLMANRRFRRFTGLVRRTIRKISDAAKARWDYWIRIMRGFNTDFGFGDNSLFFGIDQEVWKTKSLCSTQITHEVRRCVWGKVLLGITYPSITDQYRIFSIRDLATLVHYNPNWVKESVTVNTHWGDADKQIGEDSLHYANGIGRQIPWLGSKMKSNIRTSNLSSDITSPTLRKLKTLLHTWSVVQAISPDLAALCEEVLLAYTALTVDELKILVPPLGVTAYVEVHKIQINSFSQVTMPNYRPNLTQLMTINELSKSGGHSHTRHRSINYAARYFYLVGLLNLPLYNNYRFSSDNTTFHVVFHKTGDKEDCIFCCQDLKSLIEDTFITIKNPLGPSSLVALRKLKLVSCSPDENDVIHHDIVEAANHHVDQGLQQWKVVESKDLIQAEIKGLVRQLCAGNSLLIDHLSNEMIREVPLDSQLETLMLGIGVKGSFKLDPNLWDKLDPVEVYLAFDQECFWYFLVNVASSHIRELITKKVLPRRVADFGPIAVLLQQLVRSGLVQNLLMGFQKTHPSGRMSLVYGLETNIFSLTQSYLSTHWPIYYERVMQVRDRGLGLSYRLNSKNDIKDLCNLLNSYTPQLRCMLLNIGYAKTFQSPPMGLNSWNRTSQLILALVDACQHDQALDRVYVLEILPYLLGIKYTHVCLSDWTLDDLHSAMSTNLDVEDTFHVSLPIWPVEDHMDDEEMDINMLNLNDTTLYWCFSWILGGCYRPIISECIDVLKNLEDDELEVLLDQLILIHRELLDYIEPINIMSLYWISAASADEAMEIMRDRLGKERERLMEHQDAGLMRPPKDPLQMEAWKCPMNWHSKPLNNIALVHDYQLPLIPVEVTNMTEQIRQLSAVDLYRVYGGLNKAVIRSAYMLVLSKVSKLAKRINCFSAIVLGDGGGSISKLVLQIYENARVEMCTLTKDPISKTPVKDMTSSGPMELLGDVTNEIWDRFNWQGYGSGDILSPDTWPIIQYRLLNHDGPCILGICDADFMAQSRSNRRQLDESFNKMRIVIHNLMRVVVTGGTLIIRIYYSPTSHGLAHLVRLSQGLSHAHWVQNPFTRRGEKELFLIVDVAPSDLDYLGNLIKLTEQDYSSITISMPHWDDLLNTLLRDPTSIDVCQTDMIPILNQIGLSHLSNLIEIPSVRGQLMDVHLCEFRADLPNVLDDISENIGLEIKRLVKEMGSSPESQYYDNPDLLSRLHDIVSIASLKAVIVSNTNRAQFLSASRRSLSFMQLQLPKQIKIEVTQKSITCISTLPQIKSSPRVVVAWDRGIRVGLRLLSWVYRAQAILISTQNRDAAILDDQINIGVCCATPGNDYRFWHDNLRLLHPAATLFSYNWSDIKPLRGG